MCALLYGPSVSAWMDQEGSDGLRYYVRLGGAGSFNLLRTMVETHGSALVERCREVILRAAGA